jgi:hypothetical protein
MNREVHVRFWEGLAVRFRWATQLLVAGNSYQIADWRLIVTASTNDPGSQPLAESA